MSPCLPKLSRLWCANTIVARPGFSLMVSRSQSLRAGLAIGQGVLSSSHGPVSRNTSRQPSRSRKCSYRAPACLDVSTGCWESGGGKRPQNASYPDGKRGEDLERVFQCPSRRRATVNDGRGRQRTIVRPAAWIDDNQGG